MQYRSRIVVAGIVLALAVFDPLARGSAAGCAARSSSEFTRLGQHAAKKLLVSEPRPVYPPIALINYIHGKVSVLITVGCSGRVEAAHVLHGHPFLAAAVLRTIKRWIYRPLITRSGPAPFQTMVDVNFALVSRSLGTLPPRPDWFVARAVRPPKPPGGVSTSNKHAIRMRVLVNAQGHVVDSTQLSGTSGEYIAAEHIVSRWQFRPARWGTLNVPWYLDVTVPVSATLPVSVGQPAGASSSASARSASMHGAAQSAASGASGAPRGRSGL